MFRILRSVLSQLVTRGTLQVTGPGGRSFRCGDGSGDPVAIRFTDRSAILAFLGLPLYPIWSLIVITLDVLVIWALIAHGGEVRRV